jgi:hypothetical protein
VQTDKLAARRVDAERVPGRFLICRDQQRSHNPFLLINDVVQQTNTARAPKKAAFHFNNVPHSSLSTYLHEINMGHGVSVLCSEPRGQNYSEAKIHSGKIDGDCIGLGIYAA